jgi:uncharacterized membrane protein YgdD (TMEM256/DUF423 family)
MFFCIGAVSAFVGVAAGAFGAHGLKERLGPEMLKVFEVGVRYQMYHALALLAVAWAVSRWSGPAGVAAGWLFVAGTVIFSGSLYALSLSGVRWLGAMAGCDYAAGRCCLSGGMALSGVAGLARRLRGERYGGA